MSLSVPLCIIMYYGNLIYLWGTAVRLSVFFLGIHTGRLVAEDKKVTKTSLILNIAAFIVGTFLAYYINKCVKEPSYVQSGLNCYPALLMMPSFCLLVSLVLSALGKKYPKVEKAIVIPFGFLGKYSLELYLLHQRLQYILLKYFEPGENATTRAIVQLAALIITLVAAPLLGTAISSVRNALKKRKSERKTAKNV